MAYFANRVVVSVLFLLALLGLLALIVLLIIGFFFFLSHQPANPQVSAAPANPNIHFGMPAPARTDPGSPEAYLIERSQYVLSYNDNTKGPNWVSWELRQENIGHSVRGAFNPDPLLPDGFVRVTSHVYDGSGFDRGHQCPAQDRSSSQDDMDATFYLTNVVPQSPYSNQRGWERLESYCRDLTKDGQVLYIACGPYGKGGTGRNGSRNEIGSGDVRVTVPAKLWKVILVLPGEDAEPRRNTRSIAIIMPNDQSVDYEWAKFRVSVKDVEDLTGYHFFPNIPEDVASSIKDHVDDVEVHTPRKKG